MVVVVEVGWISHSGGWVDRTVAIFYSILFNSIDFYWILLISLLISELYWLLLVSIAFRIDLFLLNSNAVRSRWQVIQRRLLHIVFRMCDFCVMWMLQTCCVTFCVVLVYKPFEPMVLKILRLVSKSTFWTCGFQDFETRLEIYFFNLWFVRFWDSSQNLLF